MNDQFYDMVCKDRFEKIEISSEKIRDKVENGIPHQIDALFWKMLGVMLTFSGIVIAIVKLWR